MKHREGQVALSLVFLIGGVMIIIGATLIFVVISFLNSTFGYRASNQALAFASSGVDDALLQLARDKDFSSLSYCVPSLSCGTGTATVVVTQGVPSASQITILSTARVDRRERRVKAIASIATSTGQITLVSWDLLR